MSIKLKNLFDSENATGMLEVVILIPLAILLIFIGTDSSLRFIEQSSISSMLKKELRRVNILTFNKRLDGEKSLDLNQISQNLQNLSLSIETELLKIKNSIIKNDSSEYSIESHLVKVYYKESTGEIVNDKLIAIIKSFKIGNNKFYENNQIQAQVKRLLKMDSTSQNISKLEGAISSVPYQREKYYIYASLKTKSKGVMPESWVSNLLEINESYIFLESHE